jgi:hypothetical protein
LGPFCGPLPGRTWLASGSKMAPKKAPKSPQRPQRLSKAPKGGRRHGHAKSHWNSRENKHRIVPERTTPQNASKQKPPETQPLKDGFQLKWIAQKLFNPRFLPIPCAQKLRIPERRLSTQTDCSTIIQPSISAHTMCSKIKDS